jgi:predicted aconitase
VDAEVTDASDVSKRLLTLLAATSGTDWIVIGIPFASIPDLKELIKLMGPSSICFARLNISSLISCGLGIVSAARQSDEP